MHHDGRRVEVLSYADCLTLLGRGQIGRVVFTVGALPAIVPVTYAVLHGSLVLRTAASTELARAADDGVLAVEVDDVDPDRRTGWSVVVTGIAAVVTSPAERALIEAAVAPWAPGGRDVCIRVPFTKVTGRRIVAVAQPRVDAS